MTWEMLPGETLNGLAALFYKDDRPMQRRFVAASLKLNRGLQPIPGGNSVFASTTQILIPDLQYLSMQSPPKKQQSIRPEASPVPASPAGQEVSMVNGSDGTPDLLAQYETLVKLNASLKTELERLNQRLSQLQAIMEELLKRLQEMIALERNALATAPAAHVSESQAQTSDARKLESGKMAKQAAAEPESIKPVEMTDSLNSKPGEAKAGEAAAHEAIPDAAPATTPAGAVAKQYRQVDTAPVKKAVKAVQAPADSNNLIKIIIPILLTLVAAGSFVLIYRWRVHPLSRPTILQQPSIQPTFRPTTQRGKAQQQYPDAGVQEFRTANQPATLPPMQALALPPVQPTRELLANARLLMAENKPEAALAMLQAYVDAYPEQSILPWLHALEIHHNLHHRKTFGELADHMHDTFSEDIAAWSDSETGVSIESNAAEYQHIQDELEQIWRSDRAAFSTEVLKEIVVLQEVLKTRSQPSLREG